MKRLLFIYNPKAGQEKIKSHLADIINIFAREKYDITVYPTQGHGDAGKAAKKRAADYDLVVCSGGDGTLDEVVAGLMNVEVKIPVGYIPAGSTNDFGSTLGISKNMLKAAATAVKGKDYLCDIGKFNRDYFVYVAAFGLFTDVTYETAQDLKNVLGYAAYILEGMKRIQTIKSYSMKITYGEDEIGGDFLLGLVTNSNSVGGIKGITGKNVSLSDGLFEVLLVRRPPNPLLINDIIVALLDRRHHSDYIYSFKTDRVTFESVDPVAWTRDGEFGGEHTKVVIVNKPKALTIRV